MPLELVVTAPRQIGYLEYIDRDLQPTEVLVQTTVSGIKHGTEINHYRGTNPFADEFFDPVLRLFRKPREGETIKPFFPQPIGSWAVGVVRALGAEVRAFKVGDMVHGQWLHRQTVIKTMDMLYPVPASVDAETIVFTDPTRFALAAIHDAQIKLGDRVAIFGLGAIGMLALQMAKLNGAAQLFAVDVIPSRLALAQQLGADVIVNAVECDAGIAIKEATGNVGVDVAIELSGAYSALQQAIRCAHREGLVVTVSSYGDTRGRIDLSREWHHNRIELRSSMPVWGNALRHAPMWDMTRLLRTTMDLLAQHRLVVKPLIGARFPFERAAEAYRAIDENPNENVKTLLTYT
jgi:threonine dehydrogenase-like Zn-dependent dehydrogenase